MLQAIRPIIVLRWRLLLYFIPSWSHNSRASLGSVTPIPFRCLTLQSNAQHSRQTISILWTPRIWCTRPTLVVRLVSICVDFLNCLWISALLPVFSFTLVSNKNLSHHLFPLSPSHKVSALCLSMIVTGRTLLQSSIWGVYVVNSLCTFTPSHFWKISITFSVCTMKDAPTGIPNQEEKRKAELYRSYPLPLAATLMFVVF